MGELGQALEAYDLALVADKSIASTNPQNTEAQRDLSVSHNKVGDVQVAQGDLAGALVSYRARHAIAERLAASDASHAGWQRDLIVSYAKLGEMEPGAGWWAKGLAVAEAMVAKGTLAPRDAGIPDYLREKAAADQ